MIFVNYKTYAEASGERALALTKILEEVARATQTKIIPVVQVIDAETVINSTQLEVWIQHVDPVSYGPYTGWVLPQEVAKSGVRGVFLNHSEHKFPDWNSLSLAVEKCKEASLKTLVFAADINELKQVLTLRPDYLAYEPPELVGSTTTSVSTAKPEIVKEASEYTKASGIPLIVGAGIHSQEDVRKSLELGAAGVAVATDVVRAQNPTAELTDLTEGFR